MKRKLVYAVIAVILLAGGWVILRSSHTDSTKLPPRQTSHRQSRPEPKSEAFNKSRYSLTDPSSIWVIVNKQHSLKPVSYTPDDLVLPDVTQRVPGAAEMKMRRVAASALETMFADARKRGINLLISTAYRGYSYQSVLYNGYVKHDGKAAADKSSARPGYSEHQTGLAVDIRAQSGKCPVAQCFSNTPEGKWLAANAYKYGFLLRYPEDKESVTGYEYEPWHFRYIGTYLSEELHRTGTETLEEFFGVSGGTSYN
jgi:D-alanyl-D-alanine carboxypeptidase